jgi:hypothetical protein
MGKSSSKLSSRTSVSRGLLGSSIRVGQIKRPLNPALTVEVLYLDTEQLETLLISPPEREDENDVDNVMQSAVAERTQGAFYSRTIDDVGEWKFEDGLLFLRWNTSGRNLEFFQKLASSEIEWKCERFPCELRITNLGQSLYVPSWMNPVDPADTKKVFAKRRAERELKLLMQEGKARGDIASQYTECPLCFFELHLYPVAILRFQAKRSCPHYFHSFCANLYKSRFETTSSTGDTRITCPVCLKRFTEVKTLPELISDPRLWFQLCDTDLTGTLDKKEVIEGLLAVLPVERYKLEKALDEYWENWDASGDGYIAFQEFIDPISGLKSFVLTNYNIFKRDKEAISQALRSIPPLDSKPREWFDFWDNNKNGTLERIEMTRALIKTFCITAWGDPLIKRAPDISQLALSVWDSLGYKPRERISFPEFMKPFGLADQVIHNYVHGQFFGEDDSTN